MYNFDELTNRYNTASSKWDVEENQLPMSIADMDFKTCPAVVNAIEKRIKIGAFGYSYPTDAWKDSIINWWNKFHNFKIERGNIIFSTGVIPSISACVNRLTNVGDNVILMTPVYNIFVNSIVNHGRHLVESPLAYENGVYHIDFLDLEEKLAHPLTTMLILCNPHNPIGKIWSKEELSKIALLCKKHGVVVLSDEIHCDLCDKDTSYTPFGSVSSEAKDNMVMLISASKAFNLAGLQGSAAIVFNEHLFNKVERALNSYEVAEPNFFVIDAMQAAFNEGRDWLNALNTYLEANKNFAKEFIQKELPFLSVVFGNATYLLWIDCSKITDNTDELQAFLAKETGLVLSNGSSYKGNGNLFLRMNVATQRSRLEEGLKRLENGVKRYLKRR